jgi:hypothetical protein
VKLTTHLRLVPRSKDGWSCTFTLQYAFMALCSVRGSTGTTLPLPVTRNYWNYCSVSTASVTEPQTQGLCFNVRAEVQCTKNIVIGVITNDVSDYIHLFVSINHIICYHPLFIYIEMINCIPNSFLSLFES